MVSTIFHKLKGRTDDVNKRPEIEGTDRLTEKISTES